MDRVIWGMIGCGAVTERKSGPGLYLSERSELRAVYSRHPTRAAGYAARHGVPVVYEHPEDLFSDPAINAVYIATPPASHTEYALRSLEAGKIAYIEKPMANSYEECRAILDKSRATGIPVYVAYYRRGLEKYQKIRELIGSGALGRVRTVQLRQFLPPEPADLDREHLPWRLLPGATGGKFLDMAPHELDILQYFFGPITDVQGMAGNSGGLYDVEDTVGAVFRFRSGVMASGMWCYVADHAEDEMLIVGDKGRIRTPGLGGGPVHVMHEDGERVLEFPEPGHVAQPYIQSIVDELTLGHRSPADAGEAANVSRAVDRILCEYRKRYGGGHAGNQNEGGRTE